MPAGDRSSYRIIDSSDPQTKGFGIVVPEADLTPAMFAKWIPGATTHAEMPVVKKAANVHPDLWGYYFMGDEPIDGRSRLFRFFAEAGNPFFELKPTGTPNEVAATISIAKATLAPGDLPEPGSTYADLSHPNKPRVSEFGDYTFAGQPEEILPGFLTFSFYKTVTGPTLSQTQIQTPNGPPKRFFESIQEEAASTRLSRTQALPSITPGGATTGVQREDENSASAVETIVSQTRSGQQSLTSHRFDTWSGLHLPVTERLVDRSSATPSPVDSAGNFTSVDPVDAIWSTERDEIDPMAKRVGIVLESEKLDEWAGRLTTVKEEVVPAGTRGANLNSAGEYAEVQAVNTRFSIKTTQKVVSNHVRYWWGKRQWYWPAVLKRLVFNTVYDAQDNIAKIDWDAQIEDEYNGPCDARVEQRWTRNPPLKRTQIPMIAKEVRWNLTLTQGVVAPCLHSRQVITETIPPNHPDWRQGTRSVVIPATLYASHPPSIIGDIDVQPWRGGFLETVVEIHRP